MSAGCRPNSEAHEQHCSFRALVEALAEGQGSTLAPDQAAVVGVRAFALSRAEAGHPMWGPVYRRVTGP